MPFEHYSDSQLIDLLRKGDDEVFTELFNRYWKPLLTVAANKTGDIDEAEEIVQDLFVSLWNRRSTLNITVSLQIYLAMAVKYKVLKVLSDRSKKVGLEERTLETSAFQATSSHDPLEFEQLQSRLAKVVAGLPEKCRLVYTLSRDNGYSYKQISEEMGISPKTVEAHIFKALKTIKESLCWLVIILCAYRP